MHPILWTHRLVETLTNPFVLCLFIFALSLLGLLVYGDSIKVRAGFLLVFVGLIVISTEWLPMAMMNYFERQYPMVTAVDPNIQLIVVLGGGMMVDDDAPANVALSGASIRRLLEGVRLYRMLPGSKLLLSGGGATDSSPSVADRMGRLTEWFAIPASDRVLSTTPLNTQEEAIRMKQLVRREPFYLVTSPLHMPRAMALFQKQGLHPVAAPCGYTYSNASNWLDRSIPGPGNIQVILGVWHEILGRLWEKMTGQL